MKQPKPRNKPCCSWLVARNTSGKIVALKIKGFETTKLTASLRKKGYDILGFPYMPSPQEAINWVKLHLGED